MLQFRGERDGLECHKIMPGYTKLLPQLEIRFLSWGRQFALGKTNSKMPVSVVVLSTFLHRFILSRVIWCGCEHASSHLSARADSTGCGPL